MNKAFVLLSVATLAMPAFAQGPRGGGFGRGFGAGMFGVGPQGYVTGAPYSAVETVQTLEPLADGNRITNKHQSTVSRDAQGRIRTEETVTPAAASGKQPYTVATILDYVAGYRYMLDSSTMTATQSPLRVPGAMRGAIRAQIVERQNNRPANPNRPQVVQTSLPAQSINGVLATGTQYTQTIPAGAIGNAQPIQITRVVWMSNDLKVPVQIKSSDPRFGTTDMELTNIVQAEPSASLFVVPAGYTTKQMGGRGRMGAAVAR